MHMYNDFLKDDINRLNKTGLVYLYCSNKVLLEILENSELWLTDSSFMNDTKELILFDTVFSSIIDYMKNNHEISDDEFSIIHNLYEWFIAGHHSFFSCFSCNRDSLALWDRYGDHAHGVAIGFNLSKLNIRKGPTAYEFPIFHEDEQLGVLPVHYFDKNNDKNKIYEMIKSAIVLARREIENDKNEFNGLRPEDYYRSRLLPLCALRDITKSNHFHDENEIRIIFNEWENSALFKRKVKKTNSNLFGCYYRGLDNSIQRYYKLKIDAEDCVEQIILGAKNNTRIKDLDFLLKNMGFHAGVYKSVISYEPR